MPGLEELLAMQQPQPGGAPMPQPGGPMPGGQDAGGMAGALRAKLQELMQDPVAVKGMQDFMQQQGGGIGAPGSAQAPPTSGPMDMTRGIPPGMEAPPGAPQPEDMPSDIPPGEEQDMVSNEIDRKGATWDGVEAPTQNDIERLTAEPTDSMVESFDEQFGEGSAAKYLGEDQGADGDKEAAEGPSKDEGDHEYR